MPAQTEYSNLERHLAWYKNIPSPDSREADLLYAIQVMMTADFKAGVVSEINPQAEATLDELVAELDVLLPEANLTVMDKVAARRLRDYFGLARLLDLGAGAVAVALTAELEKSMDRVSKVMSEMIDAVEAMATVFVRELDTSIEGEIKETETELNAAEQARSATRAVEITGAQSALEQQDHLFRIDDAVNKSQRKHQMLMAIQNRLKGGERMMQKAIYQLLPGVNQGPVPERDESLAIAV